MGSHSAAWCPELGSTWPVPRSRTPGSRHGLRVKTTTGAAHSCVVPRPSVGTHRAAQLQTASVAHGGGQHITGHASVHCLHLQTHNTSLSPRVPRKGQSIASKLKTTDSTYSDTEHRGLCRTGSLCDHFTGKVQKGTRQKSHTRGLLLTQRQVSVLNQCLKSVF